MTEHRERSFPEKMAGLQESLRGLDVSSMPIEVLIAAINSFASEQELVIRQLGLGVGYLRVEDDENEAVYDFADGDSSATTIYRKFGAEFPHQSLEYLY